MTCGRVGKAWTSLFPELLHTGHVALGRWLDLSELRFLHLKHGGGGNQVDPTSQSYLRIKYMHFLYVSAEPNSIINYNIQPWHIRVTHTMTGSLRRYFTSRLAEFLALSNCPHNENIFPFPSSKSKGMRSGGWRGTLSLWGEPELPAAWKNQCQSSQGMDRLVINHTPACPPQTSVVAMVSPPLLSSPMDLDASQFCNDLAGAAWG